MKTISIFALTLFAALALSACGSDDSGGGGGSSCVSLCDESQTKNCSWVNGDCGAFCSAVDSIQDAAGCTAKRNAFQACLSGSANICDDSCDTKEDEISDCIGAYCIQDSTNTDCQTILAAVN
jgi:hypothetical protein